MTQIDGRYMSYKLFRSACLYNFSLVLIGFYKNRMILKDMIGRKSYTKYIKIGCLMLILKILKIILNFIKERRWNGNGNNSRVDVERIPK